MMGLEFFSLHMILNCCMWSEGPQAWRVLADLADEENQ